MKKSETQSKVLTHAPIKILLVDNEKFNHTLAVRVLRQVLPNADITQRYDGQDLIDNLKQGNHYDFVVLDDLMENVNGSLAIIVWRMIELKNSQNRTQVAKDEFDQLNKEYRRLNTEFDKTEVDSDEKSPLQYQIRKALFDELSKLADNLNNEFVEIKGEAELPTKTERQFVFAWSATAEGHPNGYLGADARLPKKISADFLSQSVEFKSVIQEAEKKYLTDKKENASDAANVDQDIDGEAPQANQADEEQASKPLMKADVSVAKSGSLFQALPIEQVKEEGKEEEGIEPTKGSGYKQ